MAAGYADQPAIIGVDIFERIHDHYQAIPHLIEGPLILVFALVGAQSAVEIFADLRIAGHL